MTIVRSFLFPAVFFALLKATAAEAFDIEKAMREHKAETPGWGFEKLGHGTVRAEADKVVAIFKDSKDADAFIEKIKTAFPKAKVGVSPVLDIKLDPASRFKSVHVWLSDGYYGVGIYFDAKTKELLNYGEIERGE